MFIQWCFSFDLTRNFCLHLMSVENRFSSMVLYFLRIISFAYCLLLFVLMYSFFAKLIYFSMVPFLCYFTQFWSSLWSTVRFSFSWMVLPLYQLRWLPKVQMALNILLCNLISTWLSDDIPLLTPLLCV